MPSTNADQHDSHRPPSKLYQSSRASDSTPRPSSSSVLDISTPDLTGLGLLLTVPIIFGTYNSVVKMMYAMDPPVPGIFFSAAYFWIGALTLFIMKNTLQLDAKTSADDTVNAPAETVPWWLTWKCGAELGTYLFLGASLQMYGLQSVPADRAGFLIQLTTVLVPFLDQSSTKTKTTWIASLLAVCGVVVMESNTLLSSSAVQDQTALAVDQTLTLSMDAADTIIATTPASSSCLGDAALCLASIAYSLHVVRLGAYAKRLPPLKLASAKATAQGVLSTAFLGALCCFGANTSLGADVSSFVHYFLENPQHALSPTAIGLIIWMGVSTGAWTIFAQSYGQKTVEPVTANLVYSLQPVCTAAVAYWWLHEPSQPNCLLGGALILAAVGMIATQDMPQEEAAVARKRI